MFAEELGGRVRRSVIQDELIPLEAARAAIDHQTIRHARRGSVTGPGEGELTDSARGEAGGGEERVVDVAHYALARRRHGAGRFKDTRDTGDRLDWTGQVAQLVEQVYSD